MYFVLSLKKTSTSLRVHGEFSPLVVAAIVARKSGLHNESCFLLSLSVQFPAVEKTTPARPFFTLIHPQRDKADTTPTNDDYGCNEPTIRESDFFCRTFIYPPMTVIMTM